MKIKITSLVILFFSVAVFAQDIKIPQKARDAFAKTYPKISEVKWSKEGNRDFEAEFKQEGKAISVVIDKEGKLLETETNIDIKELP